MLFWLGLVAGLIIGWVVEWIIDWQFWRRDLYRSLDLERSWREQLAQAQAEIRRLQAQLATSTTAGADHFAHAPQRDPLTQISGIGLVYEQRLNQAGIFTFAQLSEATMEQLVQIIQPEAWQQINPAAWIAQARQLVQSTDQPNSSSV
jgi:predicted flap endonuclease-1-like 5' DNA nuclease